MLFVPYGTDTPIYYWPFATIGLIVVNIIAFPIQLSLPSTDTEVIEVPAEDIGWEGAADGEMVTVLEIPVPGWWDYALSYGDGLHPIQWLTSFFMHGDIFHLLGNMMFLWVFGIVVEGKTGPLFFTLLYLAVGIVDNGIQQVMFLGADPGPPSLGASGAIYGLMMICMLFAPKDNLLCFAFVLYRPVLFGVPILIFAIFYFMWDFGFAMLNEFEVSTPFLHVMGGAVGLVAGSLVLRQQWVECDDEDLFSLLRDAVGLKPKKKKLSKKEIAQREQAKTEAEQRRLDAIVVGWRSIDQHLVAGNIPAVLATYANIRQRDPSQQWGEKRLLKIINSVSQAKNWDQAVHFCKAFIELYPDKCSAVQIHLAKILLLQQAFPRKAIKVIQAIDVRQLTDDQRTTCEKLVRKARQMIEEGTLEFDDD